MQAPVKPYPYDNTTVSGPRIRTLIDKTNDFQQPGERYRYFDSARQVGTMRSLQPCPDMRIWPLPNMHAACGGARLPCVTLDALRLFRCAPRSNASSAA